MEDALSTIIQLAIGGGIATLALWLLTDDDSPANDAVVDSKTLDINGSRITVETLGNGRSRVVAFHDSGFNGTPATAENGRLAPHWQAMADQGLLN